MMSPNLFEYQSLKPKKAIRRKELKPINNLKEIFRDIRDYFAGNVTGITRDEKIAQNIMRLLFCNSRTLCDVFECYTCAMQF